MSFGVTGQARRIGDWRCEVKRRTRVAGGGRNSGVELNLDRCA